MPSGDGLLRHHRRIHAAEFDYFESQIITQCDLDEALGSAQPEDANMRTGHRVSGSALMRAPNIDLIVGTRKLMEF
jgi:hypothetical protein